VRGTSSRRRLGREADATLGATRRQDGAARTGTHPGPEAVRARPTTIVGLERTLRHHWLPTSVMRPTRNWGPTGLSESTDRTMIDQIGPSRAKPATSTRDRRNWLPGRTNWQPFTSVSRMRFCRGVRERSRRRTRSDGPRHDEPLQSGPPSITLLPPSSTGRTAGT